MVDSPLNLVLNEGMAPSVIAVVVGLIALNVGVCLFVFASPEAAASVFAGRGNWLTLMLYRSALAFGRYDWEKDLDPGTPFPALVRNCRRRAIGRLWLFVVGAVILVLVSAMSGHLPQFTPHPTL